MKIYAVIALLLLSVAACGTCPQVCSPRVFVHLVDDEGEAIEPTTGTVTINGTSTAFSCRRGGEALDGGSLNDKVVCAGSALVFTNDSFDSLRLAINDDLGRTFDDEISLTFLESGNVMCGNKCRYANATVTVK